ncbi:circadian clock protein KaiC [Rhodopila globiformis]|uniref:circadian clock protein KaiC n=1 Tax=Rhodopila globiformis TaxID=1071 RepID=UPI0023B173A4|nr:circadian clock protein KaiC [Rhodopila globiformis]
MAFLRAELRRLFAWLRDRGLTAIITGERVDGVLTRYGLEEYISDCVILLDNRVEDQITTRRVRVVKYRGSAHGTNEYPFLIDSKGISVLPLTPAGITRPVSDDIVSSGIAGLDAMLRSGGFYRGSSILLSGVAGTGKTTAASHFADAACRRGGRCLFFAMEEGAEEVCRNVRSVGLDLQQWIDAGLLRFEAARPTLYGLEMHLARMGRDLRTFAPSVVVVDPISAFRGPEPEVHATLLRMVDLLKSRGITALFTSLGTAKPLRSSAEYGLSSLMDAWITLMDVEANGERNRVLYVIKARGISHSNQVREYRLTDDGIELIDPYIGPEGVLTGTARLTQEAREHAAVEQRRREAAQLRREIERRRAALERQIAELQVTLEADAQEAEALRQEEAAHDTMLSRDRNAVAARRSNPARRSRYPGWRSRSLMPTAIPAIIACVSTWQGRRQSRWRP